MTNTKKKQGRRSSMAALERRKAILAVLAQNRHASCDELKRSGRPIEQRPDNVVVLPKEVSE